jgi:hypothetical protein
VPDRRTHRGQHPEDARLFGPDALAGLRSAAADLAWLLSRGYASASSLKLVGDRHQLKARQRTAVARSTCSDADLARRRQRQAPAERLRGRPLWLDGYNVLTTIEAALAGGVILACRDGTYRDMASMHGSFRRVAETPPALELLGRATSRLDVSECRWFLDRPVSNSGRLKTLMEDVAGRRGWPWQIELVPDPDAVLAETDQIIVTADSAILDRSTAWFNLARSVVDRDLTDANVLDFTGEGPNRLRTEEPRCDQ